MSTDLEAARTRFAALSRALAAQAIAFRAPPPEPTTCCGRGCNGCVWEGWYAAAAWWCEEAESLLRETLGFASLTTSLRNTRLP